MRRGYTLSDREGAMGGAGLILALFAKPLLRAFFTTDPEVIALGKTFMIFAAVFMGFDGINIVVSGALRGVGDTRWMAVMAFVVSYLFFLPMALILAFPLGMGAVGAWLGATIFIVLLSGVLFNRFHGEKWREIRIFSEDALPAPAVDLG